MQEATGTTIAVVHSSIDLGKPEQNIRRIEEIAERAREEGVEILFLPPMVNGVPIFEIKKNLRIKRTAETIPGKTTEHIMEIASKCNLYIITGPILERRGSKLYRSAFIVDPMKNVKSVVSQVQTPAGYGQSSSPPIVSIKNLNIGIFIAEDILSPELVLLMKIIGVDIAIFYPYPHITLDKIVSILKTRALELRAMIISVGCTIKRKDEELMFLPTAIVDENGVVVHEILDKSTKMVKMVVQNTQKRELAVHSAAYKKLLKHIAKTLTYYVRT